MDMGTDQSTGFDEGMVYDLKHFIVCSRYTVFDYTL